MPQHKTFRPAIRVIGPSISYIPLTKGSYALIDSDDAENTDKYAWRVSTDSKTGQYRPSSCIYTPGKKRKIISLQRFLME
jgi:hypothetical protein